MGRASQHKWTGRVTRYKNMVQRRELTAAATLHRTCQGPQWDRTAARLKDVIPQKKVLPKKKPTRIVELHPEEFGVHPMARRRSA